MKIFLTLLLLSFQTHADLIDEVQTGNYVILSAWYYPRLGKENYQPHYYNGKIIKITRNEKSLTLVYPYSKHWGHSWSEEFYFTSFERNYLSWYTVPIGSIGIPWKRRIHEKIEFLSEENVAKNIVHLKGGNYPQGKTFERFLRRHLAGPEILLIRSVNNGSNIRSEFLVKLKH